MMQREPWYARDMDAVAYHRKLRGKVGVRARVRIRTKRDLAQVYTPGVAAVSRVIVENPELVFDLTNRGNTVAIVTNGTAVLGLGNVGPEAALPVMEGKALIMKELAGIDAIPLCIAAKTPDEVIAFCRALAPTVGGILLEDIRAPECFAIERDLQDIGVPVVHDDQHGTAIVVLAALENALEVAHKRLEDVAVVVNGCGAAGTAVSRMLRVAGCRKLTVCDSKGIISKERSNLESHKRPFAVDREGGLADALEGADVFIGVSAPNVLSASMVRTMAAEPVVFAMANPDPEISPQEAAKAGIAVYATGRSDLPNQVNNVLVFPGLFRGLLAAQIPTLAYPQKIRAADALASLVGRPTAEAILPSLFDVDVVPTIAAAVGEKTRPLPTRSARRGRGGS
jgi:malate dehydrogenase (oxaloacetate-decarboxylating)